MKMMQKAGLVAAVVLLCAACAPMAFADDTTQTMGDTAQASTGDLYVGAAAVDAQDGTYQLDVTLTGGSGKVTLESPAEVTAKDGKACATLVLSSPNYTYMVVDGIKYLPETTAETSAFTVPITAYDTPVTVYAETTAMDTPHEIEYQVTFDSAGFKASSSSDSSASETSDSSSTTSSSTGFTYEEDHGEGTSFWTRVTAVIIVVLGAATALYFYLSKKKKSK